jgi:hypothetical protein
MAAMKKLPPVKQKKIVQQAITKRASAPPRRNVPTLPTQASDRARQAIASRPVMVAPAPPSILPRQLQVDGGWEPPFTYEDGSESGLAPDWSNAAALFDPGTPSLDAYLDSINTQRVPALNPAFGLPGTPIVPPPYVEPNELEADDFIMRLLSMMRRRY